MQQERLIHFVGIGGAGMAPLAEIVLARGGQVAGSDREANAKTEKLQREGATVYIGHRAEQVSSETTLLVYSSAVGEDNPERQRATELGIRQLRRGAFLAHLAKDYRRPAAVSGSHGKSSITAMLAHILCRAGLRPGYLIGAALTDGGDSASAGYGSDLFITEVDESDGTHTLIHSEIGIVPNVEDDHSWSVGGAEALQRNFAAFADHSRQLIYMADPAADQLFARHPNALRLPKPATDDRFGRWRGFQAWNARLAVAAACRLGVADEAAARQLLEDFGGVARRMTVRYSSPELVVIEDYAHHPTEVAGSLTLLRINYPNSHLRVLFQPHRFARLQKYLPELARELKKADSVRLAPVFAAWSESGPVDSGTLASAIGDHAEALTGSWKEIADKLMADLPSPPVVLAVIGAGDLEQVLGYLPKTK